MRTEQGMDGELERVFTEQGMDGDMERVFTEQFNACQARVRHIIRIGNVPDPDEVEGRVWEQAVKEFPQKYREAQAAIAAGEPSPHNFPALYCTMARNRLIDYKRELGLAKRKRATRIAHVAAATAAAATASTEANASTVAEVDTSTEPAVAEAGAPAKPTTTGAGTPDETDVPRRKEVPLKYESFLPAPEESDPAVLLDRAFDERRLHRLVWQAMDELLAAEPMQFLAIKTSLEDLSDADAEARLGTNRFAIYRLRQAGIMRLRRFFAQRGYRVDTTPPKTSL